jgi:hypothetical protein
MRAFRIVDDAFVLCKRRNSEDHAARNEDQFFHEVAPITRKIIQIKPMWTEGRRQPAFPDTPASGTVA